MQIMPHSRLAGIWKNERKRKHTSGLPSVVPLSQSPYLKQLLSLQRFVSKIALHKWLNEDGSLRAQRSNLLNIPDNLEGSVLWC